MSSKYHVYWQSKLDDVRRLVTQAYMTGKSDALDVSDIESLGDRQSWHGIVRVSNLGIGKASMAHAMALGEVIMANRLLLSFGAAIFICRISADKALTISRVEFEIVASNNVQGRRALKVRPSPRPEKTRGLALWRS